MCQKYALKGNVRMQCRALLALSVLLLIYISIVIVEFLPSVLWQCWLGVRKSIRPVKIEWWGVDVVICLVWGADCLHMVQLMPLLPKTPSYLASFKSRLVFTARCYASAVLAMALCLSVCLSVTSRSSTKTAKHRIKQTTPYDTPGTLVFWSQRSPRNSTGITPYEGAKCRWGGSKSATFDK